MFRAVAAGAISAGAPIALANHDGEPRAIEASAVGEETQRNAVGIAVSAIGDGEAGDAQDTGEIAVPDDRWQGVPAAADVGRFVYLSAVRGKLTLVPPTTVWPKPQHPHEDNRIWPTILKIGILSRGGSGAVKMIVQIGRRPTPTTRSPSRAWP